MSKELQEENRELREILLKAHEILLSDGSTRSLEETNADMCKAFWLIEDFVQAKLATDDEETRELWKGNIDRDGTNEKFQDEELHYTCTSGHCSEQGPENCWTKEVGCNRGS